MNHESDNPTPFEKRTREVLEESTAKLDGRTLSRLTQARHAALARQTASARQWWRGWAPAGAVAAAAVLVVMFWAGRGTDTRSQLATTNGSGSALEDIDLLADGDAPDFVSDSDEVEFYEWASGEIES
jgi:ferric-dicitrate binding protein FerR (iron transport regulator)